MKRLIINADDYGISPSVNRAIEELMQSGAVTSASCLVANLTKLPQALAGRCGVHLDGHARDSRWGTQIERFFALSDYSPTHFDSHHHIHSRTDNARKYSDLCAHHNAVGVPLSTRQRDELRERGVKCADYTEIGWTDGKRETLERLLRMDFAWAESVHLMCHPGYVDDDLRRVSTMTYVREQELAVLSDPTFAIWLRAERIEKIGYAEL